METLRRVLQRLKLAPSDEELGRRSSVYREDGQSRVNADHETPDEVLEAGEKLREFRMLVGITTHPSFKAPGGYNSKQRPVVTSKGRPAPNLGLYPIVVANEFKYKSKYKKFSFLINLCLGLQLIVAAALTALGAGDGSRKAVTVFGAVNTVIAGFLTYLKGSGLPNRLKYYHHQWAKVRDYIDQRERDLGTPHRDMEVDVYQEVNNIRQMYEEVKADVEQNTPDRFVGSSSFGSRPISLGASPAGVGPKITSVIDGLQDARGKLEALTKDVEGSTTSSDLNRARVRLADDVNFMKNKLQQRMKEVQELERGMEADAIVQAKSAVVASEKRVHDFAEDRAKEVGDMEKHVEADITMARGDAQEYMSEAYQGIRR